MDFFVIFVKICSLLLMTVSILLGLELPGLPIAKNSFLQNIAETIKLDNPLISDNMSLENDMKLFKQGQESEDVNLNMEELLKKYGCKVQTYEVTTEDGYILTLYRIASYDQSTDNMGKPVLLMHGILSSSDDWVTPGPESGIAYLLAAQGLDVWLGNVRGNKHARRHVRLSPDSPEFWDFSWDEMGRYDLPVIIDHILNVTQYTQIIYIGHSQGTTCFFVLCSEKPEYNSKISLMIALAPIGAIPNMRGPLVLFTEYSQNPLAVISTARKLGYNEFIAPEEILAPIRTTVCGTSDLATLICSNLAFLVCGFDYSQMNITNLPVIFAHIPSPASSKQFEHYVQTTRSSKFRRFDYGRWQNNKIYGSESPPDYDLGKINVSIALLYGENDWLATEPDVLTLSSKLNSVIDLYKIPYRYFNHIDFVFGLGIKDLVFSRIKKLINELPQTQTQNHLFK